MTNVPLCGTLCLEMKMMRLSPRAGDGVLCETIHRRTWQRHSLFAVLALWLWLAIHGAREFRAAAAPASALPSITPVQIVTGLNRPTHVTHAGDNSGRLFVVEQGGRIRIIKNGVLQAAPFLDITSRVKSTFPEQGLLSVAFPPNYASKGYFYVDYTSYNGVGDTVIARYNVTANPDVADPNSEQIVLTISQPEANHNGGQLQFGPEGYLYIGMGDGGGGGDNHGTIGNAQDPATLLGKLLRINVEPSAPSLTPAPVTGDWLYYFPLIAKTPGSGIGYTIPATNPYTQTAGYRGEIWALGLRNPWRFSFDRQTGDLYIADVGQDAWEEVDFQPASSAGGENYGWRCYEGNHPYNTSGCKPPSSYVFPVAEYPHGTNDSNGCSIIGGYVYRGSAYPSLQGIYFYADLCTARVWGLVNSGGWQNQQLYQFSTSPYLTTFGEDQAGELYMAGQNGVLYQITAP